MRPFRIGGCQNCGNEPYASNKNIDECYYNLNSEFHYHRSDDVLQTYLHCEQATECSTITILICY